VKPRSALAWEAFARAGFACGSLLLPEPRCTSCPENPLRPGEEPFLLDHGCSRQPNASSASRWVITPVAAERLFTVPVRVTARDGTPVLTVLSDHYGLRVTFDIR